MNLQPYTLRKLLAVCAAVALQAAFFGDLLACTSAIITGKATPDGRPLMWKHRDTSAEQNRMVYSTKGKYHYIGLVNSDDKNNSEVWSGSNSAGFCIMNTASYNLKGKDDKTKLVDREGVVMRMALECCATTADFEQFLDTLSKPMGVEANFAVIDAQGGAAYYETNNFSYVKIDANSQALAPHGYLIRTNFSYTGRVNEGMGYIRHETAVQLFSQLAASGSTFTPEWIFASADRSYYHSLKGTDLKSSNFDAAGASGFVIDQDYIPRYTTSASIVFQGVKSGELPEHTTMWVALGFPSCSVAMPLWVKGGEKLPALLVKGSSTENAPLCEKAVALKSKVFPIKRGNGNKYFSWPLLYNPKQTGIMQVLAPVEASVFKKSREAMAKWGNASWKAENIQQLYLELNTLVEEAYSSLFKL